MLGHFFFEINREKEHLDKAGLRKHVVVTQRNFPDYLLRPLKKLISKNELRSLQKNLLPFLSAFLDFRMINFSVPSF